MDDVRRDAVAKGEKAGGQSENTRRDSPALGEFWRHVNVPWIASLSFCIVFVVGLICALIVWILNSNQLNVISWPIVAGLCLAAITVVASIGLLQFGRSPRGGISLGSLPSRGEPTSREMRHAGTDIVRLMLVPDDEE